MHKGRIVLTSGWRDLQVVVQVERGVNRDIGRVSARKGRGGYKGAGVSNDCHG
jgi:hypothetical protein